VNILPIAATATTAASADTVAKTAE
ncbi:MAG: hypothetical protein QOJ16_2388, partial [Acidobacteriota bacterium]|nr:hypothetical protein [Acidobacteriota bacterium]